MFSGEYDSADCYLDIQAGSGGTEARGLGQHADAHVPALGGSARL